MAKDPAFLLYSSDFLTGTIFMSDEQVGIYIRLLCAQHQHGGIINKQSFSSKVGTDELIREKFIECEEGFYNKRLLYEMGIRTKKSTSMSNNAIIRWEKEKLCKSNAIALQKHMQIECKTDAIAMQPEDEDEDVNINNNKEENINKIPLVQDKSNFHTDTSKCVGHWNNEFNRLVNSDYSFNRGKDDIRFSELLSQFPLEDVNQRITLFLESKDVFYKGKKTIAMFVSQFNNFVKPTVDDKKLSPFKKAPSWQDGQSYGDIERAKQQQESD